MKHYFRSSEIAHAWAHGLSDSGKCPSHMTFGGDRFFSYGTCIGEKIRVGEQIVVLFAARTYSSSTARHQSHLRGAIRGLNVLDVKGTGFYDRALSPGEDSRREWAIEQVQLHLTDARDSLAKSKRCRLERTRVWAVDMANECIHQARKWVKVFDLPADLIPEDLDALNKAVEAMEAIIAKVRREKEEQAKARDKDLFEKWMTGTEGSEYFPQSYNGTCYLRKLTITEADGSKHDVCETSLGVRFPYEQGRAAWLFCLRHRKQGWRRNGEQFPIGDYQLDSVSETGVIAGCHRYNWETLEQFARGQGWPTGHGE